MEERNLVLFMDDDPNRAALAYQRMPEGEKEATIWTKNASETIGVLADYAARLKKCYLDHDLEGNYQHSGSPNCGMEVVRFLEGQDPKRFEGCVWVVHSHNERAGTRMVHRLNMAGYPAKYRPFGM